MNTNLFIMHPVEARRSEALPIGNAGCISIFLHVLILNILLLLPLELLPSLVVSLLSLICINNFYKSLLTVTTVYYRLLRVTMGYYRLLRVTMGYYRLLRVTTGLNSLSYSVYEADIILVHLLSQSYSLF